MCGIATILDLTGSPIADLEPRLQVMNDLQQHRGPDAEGLWKHSGGHVGFGHRRLSIIDLDTGAQPMTDGAGNWITYNGEIYNYIELRQELGQDRFKTTSDTEVILLAYRKWGTDCVSHLRGMFAFAIWDEEKQLLFAARDRFGIKPLYYTQTGATLYIASEIKALLPFVAEIGTDLDAFKDYLAFQFCLPGKTLFKDILELPAGHCMLVRNGHTSIARYWEVYFDIDFGHDASYFEEEIRSLLADSVALHMRSDVPVGAYLSGGIDSSTVTSLACSLGHTDNPFMAFTGRFPIGREYDESRYARSLTNATGTDLHVLDITAQDFMENIRSVIYHLDFPVAGPGSFPQYMVSRFAAGQRKVVLGGQGGDEIFGGYTRYLIAYFEQCIKAAIDGTMHNGNFVVTYESIIPNLVSLQNYKPLLKEFWREGLFDTMDKRYFRLVDRSTTLSDEINWHLLGDYSPFEGFREIFHSENVGKESYFDLMTHFDFKTLLPALLHVEDRVSMAHGLESRVPFLDHPIVELAATIPSDIKFKDGNMKHVLKNAVRPLLPAEIVNRKDKMGFPTPLQLWMRGEARDFVCDLFSSRRAQERELVKNQKVLERLEQSSLFDRRTWGLLCIELWQQEFHDKSADYRAQLKQKKGTSS